MSVTIIIKSATQMIDDFSMDCDLTWTIGYIKDKIEELYPDNPKSEQQKLIYGGKLLPDHLSLKSVLNHSQERHIIHLVCPLPSKTESSSNDSKQTTSQSFPVPSLNPTFAPMNQPVLNHPSFSSMPGIPLTSPNSADTFQQYLAMQQMYAQFMTQYLSQYNGGVPPVTPYTPVMSVPPVQTPQVPVPQQNLTPNRPQRRVEDDERDYIDYLYIVCRAVMLFALLFYYSSLSRVFIVVSMYLFVSMYMKLKRQNQRRQLELQNQMNERQRTESVPSQPSTADIGTSEHQPASDENANAETDETATDDGTENSTNSATISPQAEERGVASVISTTASLVSAFFSSLIPSDPVPVNVN